MPSPGKPQPARNKGRAAKAAQKIDWSGHWLKLAGDPQRVMPTDNCPEKVLACIRHQTGEQDLSGNPQIGKIGIDSGLLAACINDALGTSFTKDDFPSTMRVIDVIHKACG